MKKILVPTDFSAASRNAEEYAGSLAKALGAELELLHVNRVFIPLPVGPEGSTVVESETRSGNERIIYEEANHLKRQYGVQVNGEVEMGSRSRSINRFARKIGADLIVMGIHRGERSRVFGSTVLSTIRRTETPVLIIPSERKFTRIKNIVLAVDFDEMVTVAPLDIVVEIYKTFDSSVRVVHVEQRAADLKASEVSPKLQWGVLLSSFNYQYDKVESYNIEEGIRKFIEKHPTDLLVVIAHHHNLYERMFEPIHTRALRDTMKLPLLVVKHQ